MPHQAGMMPILCAPGASMVIIAGITVLHGIYATWYMIRATAADDCRFIRWHYLPVGGYTG